MVALFGGAEANAAVAAEGAPVFANHTEGYACFRIPAVIRTPSGTLLAFAEARRNSCNDFGDVRIVMRRSRDEGKTWGALETVAENGTLQAGNPAPVVDTLDRRYRHGRILLIYCTGDAPEDAVMRGQGTRRIWYRASTDDGATWSQPAEITSGAKLPSWRHYATGPGHALQLAHGPHAGRIVVAANHSEGDPQPQGHDYTAHAFYSDDHGATWHLMPTVPYPGGNESTAAQNRDGDVVMNIRDQSRQSHARVIAIGDAKSFMWNNVFVAHDLPDPVCEGSMIAYGDLLLFSNPGSSTDRRDLTVSVSRDGGHTWPTRTLVAPGDAAYSDIVALKHRQLGILWEKGNAGGIFFMSQPFALLLRGKAEAQ
ncbi:MAG: sialidase family protein [Edaphobacter sp.]|uniref:sialidase family protein n=1 Tax=Edaphobacter sp. TaxID=1934404 RepID=UPI00238220FF|nr:sialidase family protein [Edaphobacter sp.]MDE1176773.1 sialidase family protein [Edaphobacter sp.]